MSEINPDTAKVDLICQTKPTGATTQMKAVDGYNSNNTVIVQIYKLEPRQANTGLGLIRV